eukprot:scaffold214467_cov23-Cyclotella_meneghiniana.AAC.1
MGGDDVGSRSPFSTKRLCVMGSLHPLHSCLTVPKSHHKCNEWSGNMQIGIHCPEWSSQAEF